MNNQRQQQLDELAKTCLRKLDNPDNELLHLIYQEKWLEARPDGEDSKYLDWRVNQLQAERRPGLSKGGAQPPIPGTLDERAIANAFQRGTPLAGLAAILRRIGAAWAWSARSRDKAYVMACFSELAYLHLSDYEVQGRDRYKVFCPSLALRRILQDGGDGRRWPGGVRLSARRETRGRLTLARPLSQTRAWVLRTALGPNHVRVLVLKSLSDHIKCLLGIALVQLASDLELFVALGSRPDAQVIHNGDGFWRGQ
jgi:hypothetical protein